MSENFKADLEFGEKYQEELLKYIGDYWLSFCSELKVVNFIGLSNLVYVGYNWLNSSNKLLIFDFSLLSGLSIDYQFIRNLKIISK